MPSGAKALRSLSGSCTGSSPYPSKKRSESRLFGFWGLCFFVSFPTNHFWVTLSVGPSTPTSTLALPPGLPNVCTHLLALSRSRGRCSYKGKTTLSLERWWQTRLPALPPHYDPFHCYILIAGEAASILSQELKQENAPGIDFDHSLQPPTRCDEYGLSIRDARFVGEVR